MNERSAKNDPFVLARRFFRAATRRCPVCCLLFLPMLTWAFSVGGNQVVDGESPRIEGEGDGNTVWPAGASPNWMYNWSDRYGDGSSNAVANAGLHLGTYRLYAARANSTDRGTIVIDLNGGDLVSEGEDVSVLLRRHNPDGATRNERLGSTDSLVIRNVGEVVLGGIDTHGWHEYVNTDYRAGSVSIGSAQARAGSVTIAYLHAHGRKEGRVSSGTVEIYSSSSVAVVQGIRTDSTGRGHGDILIDHVGYCVLGSIRAETAGSGTHNPRQANISLDGGDASGDLVVGDIHAFLTKTGGSYTAAPESHLTVRNYRHVALGALLRYNLYDTTSCGYGGHVTVTENITGNIAVAGEIRLEHVGGNRNRFGELRLAAGGTVTVSGLDLDKVRFATISSGSGISELAGDLLNFDTDGSGAGTLRDPVIATQTALRVPAGQRILYKVREGANASLSGKVYRIANESGAAGHGGLLMPVPVRGTVVMMF